MNIGEAAKRSGLPTKTLRFYEDIGLVVPSGRKANRYRNYNDRDVHMLLFVRQARSLGFTVESCRELLDLYRDRRRASAEVRALAIGCIGDIKRKITELETMKVALRDLIEKCHSDDRPNCPILDDLSDRVTHSRLAN